MATTPVSQGLQQLLNQQKQEAERLRQQHQLDMDLQRQQWRKEDLAARQQQRLQEQAMRQGQQRAQRNLAGSQQSSRRVLEDLFKQSSAAGLSGSTMIPVLKGTGEWQKLSKRHQDTMQRAIAGGASTGDEVLRHIESQDHKDRQRQARLHQRERRTVAERHEQERLGSRHKYELTRGATRSMLGSESLAQHARHGAERMGAREEERQQTKALQDAAKAMKETAKAIRDQHNKRSLEMRQGGMQALRGAMAGNASSLAGGLGTMMAGGEVGMIVGAIASAVEQAMTKSANTLNTLNDSRLTGAQKGQNLGEEWIPGYEKWVKLRDAINGVADKMYGLSQLMAHQAISSQHAYEKTSAVTAAQVQTGHFGNLAKAMSAAEVPRDLLKIDRSSWQGEIAYREEATRLPHKAAVSRAEAEADAARRDLRDSDTRKASLDTKGRRLKENLDRARQAEENLKKGSMTHEYEAGLKYVRKTLPKGSETASLRESLKEGRQAGDAGTEKVHRTAAASVSLKAEQDLLNHQKLVMEEINRQKELGVTLAEKESNVRKAQNQLLKADLELLKQKEQRQATAAKSLGNMNPAQRAMAVAAVKMAMKTGDVGMLPASMRARAAQVAPEMMNKLTEKSGLASKEYKQLQDIGAIEKGDLGQTRKEIAQKEVQVQVNVNVDTQALAAAIAEKMASAFGQKFEKLIDAIDTKYKTLHEQNRTNQNVKNANLT